MSTAIKPALTPVGASVDVVHCCAASFARDGKYDSAERLLLAVPAEATTAQIFDLLARIYAQQGRYADAEMQWTQAIQRDPSNSEYQQCLRVAEQHRLRPWFRFRLAVATPLILVVFVGMITLWQWTKVRTPSSRTHSFTPQRVPAKANTNDTPTEIRFQDPLFSGSTKLTRAGNAELRQIAKQLRLATRIEITGHTDGQPLKPGSKYRNNEELGFARANAVAIVLHREFDLPLTRMALQCAEQPLDSRKRPIPNLDERTVVIRVWNGGN